METNTVRLVGKSREINAVRDLMSLLAISDAPILIVGDTGTGKELVASGIHALSPRCSNAFVALNSSCLQETMLESELFGYKKGAFTGAQTDRAGLLEATNHGTLLVDEVGDMCAPVQAKLLRVLETGVFRRLGDTKEIRADVRFIFATNKDLKHEMKEGRFRADLFFRTNTLTIKIPSLNERRIDIPLLADYFLKKFAKREKQFTKEALSALLNYAWPGNIRELKNVVERAVLLSGPHEKISCRYFPEEILSGVSCGSYAGEWQQTSGKLVSLDQLQKEYIKAALDSVGGNKTRAASVLGISRKTLYNKMC